MTNKIEVPRELLERIAYWLNGSVVVGGAKAGETYNELRALLVTPEAPRQKLKERLIDSEKRAAHYQSLFREMLDCLDACTVNQVTIRYLDQINDALQHPVEQAAPVLATNESLEFNK